jgi:hypothetical protein
MNADLVRLEGTDRWVRRLVSITLLALAAGLVCVGFVLYV